MLYVIALGICLCVLFTIEGTRMLEFDKVDEITQGMPLFYPPEFEKLTDSLITKLTENNNLLELRITVLSKMTSYKIIFNHLKHNELKSLGQLLDQEMMNHICDNKEYKTIKENTITIVEFSQAVTLMMVDKIKTSIIRRAELIAYGQCELLRRFSNNPRTQGEIFVSSELMKTITFHLALVEEFFSSK